MLIPKYVQELMSRATFARGYGEPGYTIEIEKSNQYTYVRTLEAEIEKLEKWVKRVMPEDELGIPTIVIHNIPQKTHYCRQYAIVTIFDPVMQKIEKYIKEAVQ